MECSILSVLGDFSDQIIQSLNSLLNSSSAVIDLILSSLFLFERSLDSKNSLWDDKIGTFLVFDRDVMDSCFSGTSDSNRILNKVEWEILKENVTSFAM
uniref:Ovule protein n=1 Tax=Caenorhabditis tropicalis TaxID=1561998 RepID=A0A1I7T2C1_9PELO